MKRYSSDNVYWTLFLAPALLILSFFFIIPVIGGFVYSLTDWTGITKEINFVGIDNFKNLLFNDDKFYEEVFHTLIFSICITIFQNSIGLILALFLDKEFKGRNFFRMIYYLPAVLSPLVVGYAWSFIFNPNMGALNNLLDKTGFGFLAQDWLGNANLALFSVIFVIVWQYAGYSMIIYIAGLQNISLDIYEAAAIDGVSKWQKFKHITFPLLAPAFTINILLTIISTLKSFDHIFVMTKGGPGYATEVISTRLYSESFTYNNMGYGSAISVVLFLIVTSISLILLKFLRNREVE